MKQEECVYQHTPFIELFVKKTLHLEGQKCSREKHRKIRLTDLPTGKMPGEKPPILAIGKSQERRCFKGIKSLSCPYRAQTKDLDGL